MHLREQRIVKRRYFRAGARSSHRTARPSGKLHLGEQAGAGLEVLLRILGVDAHLDRVAARRVLVAGEIRRLAGSSADHPFDQIDAGHDLRHAVLDLQPGVHLQEIKRAAVGVVDELDRAGGAVIHRLPEPHRRLAQLAPLRLAEMRRGRFLDDLLVAPLRGAIALAERDHVAASIAENLHLDVPRDGHELFEKEPGVLEVREPEVAHGFKLCRQLLRRVAERMPMPPPPAVLFSITG